ncbi:MAG: hypothetical protein ABSC25_19840 [Roseiarcus sp.]|jgi:hypothetical protein
MSDAERGKKSQRIWTVFGLAAQKANVELPRGCKLDVSCNTDSAVVTVFAAEQRKPLILRFAIGADDSIFADIGKSLTLGAGGLYNDRGVDIIASAIKEAVAKEFG